MKTNTIISSAFALVLLASGTSGAAVTATTQLGVNNFFTVSTTDLADASQGGTHSFTGTASFGSNPAKLTDGGVYFNNLYVDTADTLTPTVGSTLTLHLAASFQGWDISSIVVLTGVADAQQGRSDHSYTIALSTDGTTFGAPIINVNSSQSPLDTAREIQVTINDSGSAPLGTGIKAIRFVFGDVDGFAENMYREIDVLGVASIPEPSAALLGGLGLLALLRRRRA